MSYILRYVWDKLQRIWEAFELYLELYLIVLRLSRCCSAHLIWRYVLRFEIYMRSVWDDLRRIWFTFWDISHKGLAKNQYQVFSWLAGWLIWRYALSSLRGYLPLPLSCVWLRGQDNNVSQDGPNQDQVFFCLAGWLASWLIWRYAVLVRLYPPLSWVVLGIGKDAENLFQLDRRNLIIIVHTRHLHEDQLCEREISTSPGKFPNGAVRPENSWNEGNLDCRRGIPAIPLFPL